MNPGNGVWILETVYQIHFHAFPWSCVNHQIAIKNPYKDRQRGVDCCLIPHFTWLFKTSILQHFFFISLWRLMQRSGKCLLNLPKDLHSYWLHRSSAPSRKRMPLPDMFPSAHPVQEMQVFTPEKWVIYRRGWLLYSMKLKAAFHWNKWAVLGVGLSDKS